MPDGGFYLWPKVPGDDQAFARRLYETQAVPVLPGCFLSRKSQGGNPGTGRIRLALVAEREDCIDAAERIVTLLSGNP
jgi:N-succinyldiaminopimelate aminotransferase